MELTGKIKTVVEVDDDEAAEFVKKFLHKRFALGRYEQYNEVHIHEGFIGRWHSRYRNDVEFVKQRAATEGDEAILNLIKEL